MRISCTVSLPTSSIRLLCLIKTFSPFTRLMKLYCKEKKRGERSYSCYDMLNLDSFGSKDWEFCLFIYGYQQHEGKSHHKTNLTLWCRRKNMNLTPPFTNTSMWKISWNSVIAAEVCKMGTETRVNGESGVWCDTERVKSSSRREAKVERQHKATDCWCQSGSVHLVWYTEWVLKVSRVYLSPHLRVLICIRLTASRQEKTETMRQGGSAGDEESITGKGKDCAWVASRENRGKH